MGHFIGVYTDELPKLESVIGSKSAEHFASVLKACGGRFDCDPDAHESISTALKEIIAGSYPQGEHPDGAYYLYAFDRLFRTLAHKWTVQEIYVNEESFPEIWSFVWGSVDNEADFHLLSDDPFRLPQAESGPICWHRDLKLVRQEIRRLGNLDYGKIVEANGTDYKDEVAAILDVLKEAERSGQGVFVSFLE